MYTEEKKSVEKASQMIANDPIVVGQNKGKEYTEWEYDLPNRTRTVVEWTQDVYSDGSLGEKVYGEPSVEQETASVNQIIGDWDYSMIEVTSQRTRSIILIYTFTDSVQTIVENDTEDAVGVEDKYLYSYREQKRKGVKRYTFANGNIYDIEREEESGEVKLNIPVVFDSYIVPAQGGILNLQNPLVATIFWNGEEVTTIVGEDSTVVPLNSGYDFTVEKTRIVGHNRGTIESELKTYLFTAYATFDLGLEILSRYGATETVPIYQQENKRDRLTGAIRTVPASLNIAAGSNQTNVQVVGDSLTVTFTSGANKLIALEDGSMTISVNQNLYPWLSVVWPTFSTILVTSQANQTGSSRTGEISILYSYGYLLLNSVLYVNQSR